MLKVRFEQDPIVRYNLDHISDLKHNYIFVEVSVVEVSVVEVIVVEVIVVEVSVVEVSVVEVQCC